MTQETIGVHGWQQDQSEPIKEEEVRGSRVEGGGGCLNRLTVNSISKSFASKKGSEVDRWIFTRLLTGSGQTSVQRRPIKGEKKGKIKTQLCFDAANTQKFVAMMTQCLMLKNP